MGRFTFFPLGHPLFYCSPRSALHVLFLRWSYRDSRFHPIHFFFPFRRIPVSSQFTFFRIGGLSYVLARLFLARFFPRHFTRRRGLFSPLRCGPATSRRFFLLRRTFSGLFLLDRLPLYTHSSFSLASTLLSFPWVQADLILSPLLLLRFSAHGLSSPYCPLPRRRLLLIRSMSGAVRAPLQKRPAYLPPSKLRRESWPAPFFFSHLPVSHSPLRRATLPPPST